MKAVFSSSDQYLELSIYADDQKLQEHVLPDDELDQNILECFIPVQEGQKLTVKGKFEGKCLQASFDLVVDGSFLADSRLEDKGSRPRSRPLQFGRVYDCPAEKEGWTSATEPPIDVYEGHMYVEEIGNLVNLSDVERVDCESERPGVGSIQVVANLQDFEGEQRFDPEWDIHGGGWLRRHKNPVRPAGIEPDCAMEIRHTSNEKIHQKRSRIHRNHGLMDTRYGIVPWARFVFYYRKQESIEAAGCIIRDDVVRELKRHDGDLATPLKAEKAYEDGGLQSPEASVKVERTMDTSWETQVPFSTTALPKLSRLGGDFGALMPPQPQPLQRTTDPHARRVSTDGAEIYGETMEAVSDIGSQEDSLVIEESSLPPKESIHRDTLFDKHRPANTSLQQVSLAGVTSKTHSPSAALTTSTSRSSANKVSSKSATPDPNDMAKIDEYLIKLPSLDQLADFIGADGSNSLETSKYFGKIAKENGFPANGSVRNKLKTEYNLLIRKIARVNSTSDRVTLKHKYMDPGIKQEEDTIEAMPKQQHNKPPPTAMVARSIENPHSAMPSPAVSERTNVLKRPASTSSTPDTIAKKAKLVVENTPEVEAARRRIEENKRITETLMKEREEKQAKKAAKKAQRAAEKQKEAEELERQRRVEANAKEIEILAEEERTQKAQIDALKTLAGDEDNDGYDEDSEDGEDDEDVPEIDFDHFMPDGEVEEPDGGVEVQMEAEANAEPESEED